MKKLDYKKILPGLVVALLCFFFVFGIVWGANSLLEMEGTMAPANLTEGLTPCPEDEDSAVAFLNAAIDMALNEAPQLSSSDSFSINNDSISIGDGGNSMVNIIAKHIREGAEESFESCFDEISADYGAGFADKLWTPNISAEDVTGFDCTYIYYTCKQCSEDSDEAAETCPGCDYPEPLEMRYRDEYTLTFYFADEDAGNAAGSPLDRCFHLRSEEEIRELIGSGFDSYLTVGELNTGYKNARITARINRMTNKIRELVYYKEISVNAAITFNESYAELGSMDALFETSEEVKFSFSWPSIRLSENEKSIEFGKTDNLTATLTCNDPVKQTVLWSSSDESIATVDSEGYIKAGDKPGITIISASFEFGGKTYTDQCEVYVKTPVESIDISQRKAELKVGETLTLSASVSPKKATVQTVKWYSTNEKIATVDENGVITAIGVGNVEIYALSDDGYYKATCKTEVTE